MRMRLVSLVMAMLLGNHCFSQQEGLRHIYGEWKVVEWLLLESYGSSGMDNKEYRKDRKKFVNSKLLINEKGIQWLLGQDHFSALTDTLLHIEKKSYCKVVEDNTTTVTAPAYSLEEGIVGERMARAMVAKQKSIEVWHTNQPIPDWGEDAYLRILLLDKDRIVVYAATELLVLQRKKRQNR
ncbi:MAG: hypothetical protein P0Y53_10685 [Candidatus Pseudobacter hemicellulosilyticus]|uniref:Uncharacterized protein n=1 Tax=Candidatus Pseudobacter hemicellulosilyticus TaxID=3121375 RepID=A0AAJ5X0Q8_9BACT|nr:MAG: hypothetical protein P0Y53_10685 [Pseudobacter sp.]